MVTHASTTDAAKQQPDVREDGPHSKPHQLLGWQIYFGAAGRIATEVMEQELSGKEEDPRKQHMVMEEAHESVHIEYDLHRHLKVPFRISVRPERNLARLFLGEPYGHAFLLFFEHNLMKTFFLAISCECFFVAAFLAAESFIETATTCHIVQDLCIWIFRICALAIGLATLGTVHVGLARALLRNVALIYVVIAANTCHLLDAVHARRDEFQFTFGLAFSLLLVEPIGIMEVILMDAAP